MLSDIDRIFHYFQVEEAAQEEAKGRIRFRLEYDFTLQELKVTVSTESVS